MTRKPAKKFTYIVKGILSGVCLLGLVFPGCQQTPGKVPAVANKPKPTTQIPDDSQTITIDEETARILKRHSVKYDSFSSDTTGNPADAVIAVKEPYTDTPTPDQSEITEGTSAVVEPQSTVLEPACTGQISTPDETENEPNLASLISPDETFEDITTQLPTLSDPNLTQTPISINFNQTDIVLVIKTIGDMTGINFIVDESITGNVTVLSNTELPLGELYHFLESILEVKGLAAVPTRDHVKIVPRSGANKRNLLIRIGCDPAQIPQNDSVVTQIMHLKYANADEISSIFQGCLAADAKMDTYRPTNTILLTDTSSNIHRIANIIGQLDVPSAKAKRTVIHLKYASAQALAKQIMEIMEKNKTTFSPPGRPVPASQTQTGVQIQPDPRISALVVVADEQDTNTIKELVRQLDIETPAGSYNFHVVPLYHAQAKEAEQSLRPVLANLRIASAPNTDSLQGSITADESTNSLIITASAQDFKVLSDIIKQLDIVRENVLVELLIMEVSQDKLLEIGIDWATFDQAVSDGVRGFANTNFGVRVDAVNGESEGLTVGAFKDVGGNTQIGAIINAMETESGVNILSTPHILASNHKKAKIIVGDNIPFVIQTRITESDPSTPTVIKNIDYKDVGVSLEITPHISHKDMIRLVISSQFTQLIDSITGLSADTPTTSKRQIDTEISMASGKTVVIGGLIRDDKITIENKIPLIGDIPLIGNLFKFQRDRLQKTNLLLFITPYVLSSQSDLANVTLRKQNEIAPELGQRVNDKNIENEDILKSIWR